MVTLVEEAPVQLAGRGLTYRPTNKFQPGEYEILDNLEISPEGTIKSRRGFNWYRQHVTTSDFLDNHRRFIGHYGPFPLIVDRSHRIYMGYSDASVSETMYLQNIDPEALIKPQVAAAGTALPGGYTITNSTFGVEAFWFYNDHVHYLVEYRDYADNGGGLVTRLYRKRLAVFSHHKKYVLRISSPSFMLTGASDDGSPTVLTLLDQQISAPGGNGFASDVNPTHYVKNQVIHKDRSWVASSDTVFFSAAGDHSVWTAPDGGFIKFPNEEIKQIYALGDIVYVFCDARIYAITYNTDFNTDGETIIISAELGGESVCAVGDTLFTYKNGAIYSVSGTNVSKVLDTNLPIPYGVDDSFGSFTHGVKIGAFDNELYLFMYRVRGTNMIAGIDWWYNTYNDNKIYSGELDQTHLYKINLETGSTSRVNLAPSLAKSFNQVNCRLDPVDMLFVPVESTTNQNNLFILHKAEVGAASGFCLTYPGINVVSNSSSGFNEPNKDMVLTNTYNTLGGIVPELRFKIKDFSPDNSKYNMKKFRTLLLEAALPKLSDPVNANIYITYGESSPIALFLYENTSVGVNDPAPFKFGLNQRARYMSIDFRRLAQTFVGTPEENLLEISDLRILWTPTARTVVSNTSSS